jgi:RNA polymerase sigma-70 factor (ECF subfamily)
LAAFRPAEAGGWYPGLQGKGEGRVDRTDSEHDNLFTGTFDEAVRCFSPCVRQVAACYAGGDPNVVDDIEQEVWLYLWTHWERRKPTWPLCYWLRWIARRRGLDHVRKAGRHIVFLGDDLEEAELADPIDERARVEATLEHPEEIQRISNALNPEQQRLFDLRVFKQQTYEQIASTLGVAVTTAYARWKNVLQRVRTLLFPE